MASETLSVAQLVDAARRDIATRANPPMRKTASSQAAPSDLGTDTATVLNLVKVGKQLADRMKTAEDSMEGKSGVQSPGPASGSDKGTMVTTGTSPDQHIVAPKGEANTDASSGPYGVAGSTSAKPGEGTLVPGMDTQKQTTPPEKIGQEQSLYRDAQNQVTPAAASAARAVHDQYAQAAAKLAQAGVAQPTTATGPLALEGKPEASQASSDTSGGDKPPTTEDGVRDTTRQETHREAVADAAKESLPGTASAAISSTEGVLDKVLDEAKTSSIKAAAFREWFNHLNPNSKLACAMRARMAQKVAQVPEKTVTPGGATGGTPVVPVTPPVVPVTPPVVPPVAPSGETGSTDFTGGGGVGGSPVTLVPRAAVTPAGR